MENNSTLTSKKVAVTFTLPTPRAILISLREKCSVLLSRVSSLAYSIYNPMRKSATESVNSSEMSARRSFNFPKFPNIFRNFNRKKLMRLGLPILVAILAVVGLVSLVSGLPNAKSNPAVAGENIEVADALSSVDLNRTFAFPLRDDEGEEVGKFDFTVENAEIQKQIIVQGKRATAVNGRVFLVFNLKIVNNLKYPMELPTRNFMRIILNNNSKELLAPDIHNDPVEVQAISTKYTRLGLAIDESAVKQTIKVQIGEVDGQKQTIDLNFK